jgi:hypothetical protein
VSVPREWDKFGKTRANVSERTAAEGSGYNC